MTVLTVICSVVAVLISSGALWVSISQHKRNRQMHGWAGEDRESGSRRWEVESHPEHTSQITLRNAGTTEVHNVVIDDGDGTPLTHDVLKAGHIIPFELAPGSLAHPVTVATVYWTAPGEGTPREYQFRD